MGVRARATFCAERISQGRTSWLHQVSHVSYGRSSFISDAHAVCAPVPCSATGLTADGKGSASQSVHARHLHQAQCASSAHQSSHVAVWTSSLSGRPLSQNGGGGGGGGDNGRVSGGGGGAGGDAGGAGVRASPNPRERSCKVAVSVSKIEYQPCAHRMEHIERGFRENDAHQREKMVNQQVHLKQRNGAKALGA
eukprot:6176152-Pleurochrysis_carterae.AAC.2